MNNEANHPCNCRFRSSSVANFFFPPLNQNNYSVIMISRLFTYYRNKTMLSSPEEITVIIRINRTILDFEKF